MLKTIKEIVNILLTVITGIIYVSLLSCIFVIGAVTVFFEDMRAKR